MTFHRGSKFVVNRYEETWVYCLNKLETVNMTQFEKTFHIMKNPVVFLFYTVLVILTYQFADRPIALYFHHFDPRTHIHGLNILTSFGKWSIYILLFSLAGLFFRYVRQNKPMETKAWFLLGCIVVPNLVGFVIKIILSRARPELLIAQGSFGFYWIKLNDFYWSFPSGHTITVVSLAAGLGVLFPKYFYTLLGLALLVVMSRVFLYFHYLSDVMAGFYLAILVVGIFTEYLQRNHYITFGVDKKEVVDLEA
jgi:membrane-associated phospholipid phosphatase